MHIFFKHFLLYSLSTLAEQRVLMKQIVVLMGQCASLRLTEVFSKNKNKKSEKEKKKMSG